MFNKDALFGKKDENVRIDPRSTSVNVTPDLTAGLQQRPVQPAPARMEEAYAGEARAPRAKDEPAGSKLIVGPDIKLKGVEITDCDTLVVEGRVEASMDSRVVQIAREGVFNGNATMDIAEIWGTFDGQLTVRQQLVVYATGRVSGEIRYGRIRIEEGGEVSGNVRTLSASQAPQQQRAAQAAAPAPARAPAATTADPASAARARPGAAAYP